MKPSIQETPKGSTTWWLSNLRRGETTEELPHLVIISGLDHTLALLATEKHHASSLIYHTWKIFWKCELFLPMKNPKLILSGTPRHPSPMNITRHFATHAPNCGWASLSKLYGCLNVIDNWKSFVHFVFALERSPIIPSMSLVQSCTSEPDEQFLLFSANKAYLGRTNVHYADRFLRRCFSLSIFRSSRNSFWRSSFSWSCLDSITLTRSGLWL